MSGAWTRAGGGGRGGAGTPLGSERRGTRVLAQLCSCDPGRFALALSQHIGRSGLALLPPRCPGRPGVLQSMGSQRIGNDLATEQQQRQLRMGPCFPLICARGAEAQGPFPGPPQLTA